MHPRRRWFQFNLRILVLMLLVSSVVMGFYARARRKWQEQWNAANAIADFGGYFNKDGGGGRVVRNENAADAFWQNWVGMELPPYGFLKVGGLWHGRKPQLGPIMKTLPRLPQLNTLVFREVDVTNEDLKTMSKMPNLAALDIASNQITDEGLASFAGNPNLEELRLSGHQLSDSGLAIVTGLPNLKTLAWDTKTTTDEGLSHLRAHPRLTFLSSSGAEITDVGLEHLSTCEKLESLNLNHKGKIMGNGVRSLARVKNLKELTFHGMTFSEDSFAAFSELTNIELIELEAGVSPAELAHFGSLPSLSRLILPATALTGEGLANLSGLKRLRELRFRMSALQDEDMQLLSTFSELEELNLDHSKITDVGLLQLASMKGLKRIHLVDTRVTEQGIKRFVEIAPQVNVVAQPPPDNFWQMRQFELEQEF